MLKPEQVPHAAMNALLLALRQRRSGKEAIAAAINAWPGMSRGYNDHGKQWEALSDFHSQPTDGFILPLPKEPEGDDAHEFVSDWYRPARCLNCGQTRDHASHKEPEHD